jgi:hypothetical protein
MPKIAIIEVQRASGIREHSECTSKSEFIIAIGNMLDSMEDGDEIKIRVESD